MKKARRVLTGVTAIIAILLMLSSCIRLKLPVTSTAETAIPTASATPPAGFTPSQSPAGDVSGMRPAYDDTNRTQYDIQVKYDEASHSATATQSVKYTNTVKDGMDAVYMHIYPNHFSKQEYVDMTFSSPDEIVYPDNKFNPGWIKISSVKAAGAPVAYEVQGEDETILKIPLAKTLAKGASIELGLEYSLQVPHRMGRFAWGDTGTSFANWYPIMAMYDKDGWSLDKYYELGDPFYSETADYKVSIDMPMGMEAAFTGDIENNANVNGRRVISVSETGVRDFAFVLSRKYIFDSNKVDGIEVNVAMPKEDEAMMDTVLDYATKSVSVYDKRFGKYTNDTLTVAFTDDYGGMEYPGIVFIDANLLKGADGGFLAECVVHEIGHQWWYSAVGNDEIEEPWLDESLTSFTELVYFSDAEGMDLSAFHGQIQPDTDSPLERSLPAFKGWDDYGYIYTFGQVFFLQLKNLMGEGQFFTMLQKYYATYAYGIAKAADLRALVVEMGNDKAVKWFDQCVYGKEMTPV